MGSLGRLPLGVTMAATAILDYPALRRPPSRVAYLLQYQSDGKDLADGVEYLYWGAKLVS